MLVSGIVPTSIDSIRWQDYRSSETGMVVYYNTDPVSEIPLRELPEDLPTEIVPEPNYETCTYGFYGCKHTKTRSSFNKKKIRYLFLMTRYSGTNVDYMDELIVTGFYRIKQIADVQKLHIRYLNEYSCINEDSCLALRADKVHFVAANDSFMITSEVLESWECKSRITRQSKIILNEEKTAELLAHLESKNNIVDLYSSETERLQPSIDEDDEEEDEGELFEDAEDYEEIIDEEEEGDEEKKKIGEEQKEVEGEKEEEEAEEEVVQEPEQEKEEEEEDTVDSEITASAENAEVDKEEEGRLYDAETEVFEKKEESEVIEKDIGSEEAKDNNENKKDVFYVDFNKPEEDKSNSL